MSIALQKQIKDNSTSVSEFFSDLYKWTEEKDYEEQRRDKVKSGAPRPTPSSGLPATAEEPNGDGIMPAPIERDKLPMPQYYHNWESYDAEAEAERHDEVELEVQRKERVARKAEKHRILDDLAFDGDGDRKRTTKARPMVKVSVKTSGRRASPVDLAAPKKVEANRLFAEGRYREAANMYSMALEYLEKYLPPDERPDPTKEGDDAADLPEDLAGQETEAYELKTALLANRAAACVKMEEWRDAVEDCTDALRFDPSHHKALLRRGFAFAKTKRWLYASRDLTRVVEADPSDKKAKAELVMARRMLVDTAKATRVHAKAQMCDPTREQTMPVRRLVVRSRRAGEAEPAEAPQPQPTKSATARGAEVLKELDRADRAEQQAADPPLAKPVESARGPRKPYVPRSVRVRGLQSQQGANGTRAPAAAGGGIGVAAPADAPAPTHMNFYAFEAAWTRARTKPRERAALLRKVGPDALPTLCQHSLDAELLSSIVDTLLAELAADGGLGQDAVQLAAAFLASLARTPRFELSMGGLSAAEWRACTEVLDALDVAGCEDAVELRGTFSPFAPKPRAEPAVKALDSDDEMVPEPSDPLPSPELPGANDAALAPAVAQGLELEESLLDGCD